MKENPQDPQSFDAAFDARCREMLSQRVVKAPPFVEPTAASTRMGRRLALATGTIMLIGMGGTLMWTDSDQSFDAEPAVEVPTVSDQVVEPASVLGKEAMETSTPTPEDAGGQPEGGSVEGLMGPSAKERHVAEGPITEESQGAMSPSTVSGSVTEADAFRPVEAELNGETEAETREPLMTEEQVAPATQEEVGDDVDEAEEDVEPVGTGTEPAAEKSVEEPVLRLPLTLPAGGGY